MRKYFILMFYVVLFAITAFAEDAPLFYGNEIVVTASRMPQLKSTLPVSTTIITSKEIETLGAKNLGDVLKYTFGTFPRTTGFLGSQISGSIRGASYQQMLIMIDGQRVNSPLLGGYDLGDLSVDKVERIEIVRGPASALYGADAVGGVINVISIKDPAAEKNSMKLISTFSEKETNDTQLLFAGKGEAFDYSFSAGQSKSLGYRDNSDFLAQNYKADFSKNFADKYKIGAAFDLYYAYKGVPGSLTFPTLNTRQNDDNQHFRIYSEAKINDWWNMKLSSSFGSIKQLFSTDPSLSPYSKYLGYSSQHDVQNNLKLGDSDIFAFGGEYRNDEANSVLSGNHLVTNKAVFFQDQHYFMSNLSFLASVRYDEHSIYGDTNSPRVGLIYEPNNDSSIWVSYGESFRAPTLNDLYTYYVDPVWGMIMKGNRSLKPESGKNTEVGFTSRPFQNVELSMNYFTGKVDNLIQWVDISGTWMTWEAQNVASANISGYEVGVVYHFTKAIKYFVNYSALSATDGKTGKDLPYKPRMQHNMGLEYNDESDNSASIFLRHVGERYDDTGNTRKVDPYTVADVNLRFHAWERTILRLGTQNIFNEDYQDTFDYPMPGRIYTFGIQYDLL